MLKNSKCLGAGHITIWENRYIFDDHYICATALYVFSLLCQYFNINIYRDISAPGHGR